MLINFFSEKIKFFFLGLQSVVSTSWHSMQCLSIMCIAALFCLLIRNIVLLFGYTREYNHAARKESPLWFALLWLLLHVFPGKCLASFSYFLHWVAISIISNDILGFAHLFVSK